MACVVDADVAVGILDIRNALVGAEKASSPGRKVRECCDRTSDDAHH